MSDPPAGISGRFGERGTRGYVGAAKPAVGAGDGLPPELHLVSFLRTAPETSLHLRACLSEPPNGLFSNPGISTPSPDAGLLASSVAVGAEA